MPPLPRLQIQRVNVDFTVEMAPPRPGDPARIVADSTHIRQSLHWRPRYDDLATIVGHALAWERQLMRRNASRAQLARA